ncbi:MAG: ATP-binding protein [Actinomycetota bacterium]
MAAAPIDLDNPAELDRLALLHKLELFDTPPEEMFDTVTSLAAELCGQPTSLVSLVGEHRQYFKSRHGVDLAETPREVSFCSHAVDPSVHPIEILEVPDTHVDERFRANPLVTGDPHIRFYAGVPLRPTGDLAVGTLCVIGQTRSELSEHQRCMLIRLGALTEQLLRLRLMARMESMANTRADERETQYRYLADNTADMVLIHDPELEVRYSSPNVTEFLGYEQDEAWGLAAGRPVLDPEGRNVMMSALQTLGPHRPTVTCRVAAYRKDGTTRDVEVHSRAILEDGAPVEYHSVARDISHLLAYERELAVANRRLQDMVDQRTRLIRGIAHDLAAPLAAIRVTAESLTSQLTDGPMTAQAARLQGFALSAEAFAGDLRRVADPDNAEYALAPRQLPVRPIIERAVAQVAHIPDGNLTMRLDDVDAFIDPHALSRVVTNLVTNAGRHTPPGTPIEVSLTGSATTVTLRVADEGYGIPANQQSLLLEPYVATTKTGSGLGLAITRTLVEGSGGRLAIEANQPTGAVVSATFPATSGSVVE